MGKGMLKVSSFRENYAAVLKCCVVNGTGDIQHILVIEILSNFLKCGLKNVVWWCSEWDMGLNQFMNLPVANFYSVFDSFYLVIVSSHSVAVSYHSVIDSSHCVYCLLWYTWEIHSSPLKNPKNILCWKGYEIARNFIIILVLLFKYWWN